MSGTLFAVSDLHVSYPENRQVTDALRPESDEDWLLVAGDVGEIFDEVVEVLRMLSRRFAKVIWAPGNHELWTHPQDPVRLRGDDRYRALVEASRELGVLTPEDDYAVWPGEGGPLLIAPLFLLYDYSFRAPGTRNKSESLQYAYDTGVVCSDEVLLHPDPYPSREAWCRARVAETERRLGAVDPALHTVLVSHWPLIRRPTEVLRYPEFAQWCGTELTADWHVRFRAELAVYGHLHIPRSTVHDGVRFEEVSLGYPREWRPRRGDTPRALRAVLDVPAGVR
ncbi:metallophosphoesterase family protein [Micromonospora parathelypteridis]|uniref:3',5'-cyclic AMP phosphodiesterase CpdA n=1 Tax=Micromonospora parathelypteridis TaxID=1839617 RepID=A0A840VV77_9ACTN|nr:metallophosphoesterase [Micromonospora parathelypteridis]MBB5476109.1 3',5'-cyclic AMP phosphodiesterase CpdA [Micromonospora parathelypteridis]GGO32746.1 metallophosphoesterase [Micromonospora parathelypteridis]